MEFWFNTIVITVIHCNLIVKIGNDTTIYDNEILMLNAGSGYKSYLWNNNSINSTLTIDGSSLGLGTHNFFVKVIDLNGCPAYDTIVVKVLQYQSLEDDISKLGIKVYPNPNNGSFIIEFQNEVNEEVEVIVFDLNGKTIYQNNYNPSGNSKQEIVLGNGKKGIYYLRVSQSNGQTSNRKLIVY